MDILNTAFSESLTLSLMVIFKASLLNFSRDQRLRVRQILLLFIAQDQASQLVYYVLKVCFLLATFSVTFGFFLMRLMEDLEVETSGWKVQLSNSLFSLAIFFFQFYVCFFMWSIRKRSQIVQLPYLIWRLLIFWVQRKVSSCWQVFSLKEFASLLEEARVFGRKVSFSGVGDLLQRVTLSLQKNWKFQMIQISSSGVKNLLQLGPMTIIEMNSCNFYDFSVPKLSFSARREMIFCTS